MSQWRDAARKIVGDCLAGAHAMGVTDPKELRQLLKAAYPFGQRAMHPYKIWCDEVRLQLGLKKDKRRKRGEPLPVKSSEGQASFLEATP
jgi:hypothetical protein